MMSQSIRQIKHHYLRYLYEPIRMICMFYIFIDKTNHSIPIPQGEPQFNCTLYLLKENHLALKTTVTNNSYVLSQIKGTRMKQIPSIS